MSNHLAIAAVTATLKRMLQEVLDTDVPGATATMLRPHAATENSPQGVNIYLYQVVPNSSFRGVDLPTRRDRQIVNRPQVGLNLHYLFSFYGNETRLEPQAVLGSVVRALHSWPVLTSDVIAQTLADPTFSFVAASDLNFAVESVKFTPSGLTFEEFSKLWSVLFQIPYVLSVTYEGSVVLIDKTVIARSAPPVRTARVQVNAAQAPVITQLLSRATEAEPFDATRPIGPGDTLHILGDRLQGSTTRVIFTGDFDATPATVAPQGVTVAIPAALRAGPQAVAVSVAIAEDVATEVSSNPMSFTLRPRILGPSVGAGSIDIHVVPPIGKRQRVTLLLKETPSPVTRFPRALALDETPRPTTAPHDSTVASFPLAGIAEGTYLASIRVDGAESPLHFDGTTGLFDGPTVTVP